MFVCGITRVIAIVERTANGDGLWQNVRSLAADRGSAVRLSREILPDGIRLLSRHPPELATGAVEDSRMTISFHHVR